MKYICPLMTVSDIKRSRDFYEKVLNQKVKEDYGENVVFHGDFSIHLNTHFSTLIGSREIRSGGNNFEIYFESDKLEEMVRLLKLNNVEFVHPLREQPWRQMAVRFYDPDKNIIEVGESFEHLFTRLREENMTTAQMSAATGMSEDAIVKILENISGEH